MRNTRIVKATATTVLICSISSLPYSQAAPQATSGKTMLTRTPLIEQRPASERATGKPASVTREAIQAIYNEQNTLLAKKDSGRIWRRHAADYKSILANRKTQTLADLRPGVDHLLKKAKLIKASTTLQDMALEGNTLRVMVREAGTIIMAHPQTGRPLTIYTQALDRETWIKVQGQWRLKRTEAICGTTTVNGKVVPE
jgi:hypothetical protein